MGGELYRERPSIKDLERMADVEAQQYHRYLLPEQKVKYPSYEELGPIERGWLERGELLTEEEWREEAKQQYRKKLGLGHLQPLPRDWFRTWARTAEALDFYSGKLAERYGVEKGGVFEKLSKNWNYWADELDKGAKRGMINKVMGAMGSAAGVISQVMALGPGGLATYGAITGGAEAGAKGAVVGGIQGALTHGILGGIGRLPVGAKPPAAFGFGFVTEPGTLEQKLESGFTWAGLEMAGGKRAIGMREFIDNYPRIKAKLDDRAAWKFIKKGIPGVTKEQVKAEGGAKEVLDEVMRDVKEQMEKPLVTPEPTIVGQRPDGTWNIKTASGTIEMKPRFGKKLSRTEVEKALGIEPAPTVAPEGVTVNVKPQPDGSWEIKLPPIEKEKPIVLKAKEAARKYPPGWPKNPEQIWRDIHNVTGGKLMRRFKGDVEKEEMKPIDRRLIRKDGYPPDEVADMLMRSNLGYGHYEDHRDLFEDLARRPAPIEDVVIEREKAVVEGEAKDFKASERKLAGILYEADWINNKTSIAYDNVVRPDIEEALGQSLTPGRPAIREGTKFNYTFEVDNAEKVLFIERAKFAEPEQVGLGIEKPEIVRAEKPEVVKHKPRVPKLGEIEPTQMGLDTEESGKLRFEAAEEAYAEAKGRPGEVVSEEALNRARTFDFYRYDTRTGKVTPIVGVDALDRPVNPNEIKFQRNKQTDKIDVLEGGDNVTNPRGYLDKMKEGLGIRAEKAPAFNRDIAMAEIERVVKARWGGKTKSEIDDIVNEVAPTVLRSFDPFKGVKLNTYVTKMLTERYFPDGTLKGQFKKVPEEAKPEIIDRLTQKMPLPEEILEKKERVKTVTEVLDELTDIERAYAHDLMSPKPSVEKVAKRLGVSRETARKGRLKVLEKLRKNDKLSAIVLPYDAWKSEKEGGFFRIGSGEAFEGSIRSRLYKDLFDKFHAIKKLEDIVKAEGIEIPFHKSAYINARTIAGVTGKAETKILYKRFTVDNEGNIRFEGKSLRDITMPVREEIDNFDKYLVYRRVPELAKRGIETGITVEEAKAFTEKFKKFEPQAKEFTEFHTALLDEMVGAGLLKKDAAQAIKANNQMYAPFQRVIEDLTNYGYIPTSKSAFSKIKAPIKRIKGSLRPIISPLESTVKGTYVITEAIERNKVFNRLIDLRKLSPAAAELIKPIRPKMAAVAKTEEGETIWRPSTFQKQGVIEGLTKGERHFYEVPADLYDSMTGLTESGFNWVVKVMSLPARILRTGATTTPEFAFRNPIRDQWFAFFNAKYGYVPFYDFAKGLFQLGKKKETYWKWKAAGGEWSMLVTLDRAANHKMLKQVLGASDYKRYMKNPISLLEDISMVMEMPTRIGTFGRAEKKVSDVEAAYQSREASIDFARRGARMKTISSLATFLNANIQARDKTIRTFAENPTKALLKLIPITVVPSVINYLTNRDDPKYWELSEFRRDMFWNIKIKGNYWGIPKGDLGIMFGTTTEKILEYMDKDRETRPEIDKMATMVIKQMSPISDVGGFLPVALRPPVEVMANQKYYTGTPIVSRGKEDLFPELQYGPYTSETAKAIGKKVGIAPSKLEHIITGYGAGLSRHALKISDWMLGEMGAIEKKPKSPKELADYPLVGAFVARDPEGFNSDSVNKFYEVADKVQKYNRNINEFKRRGMREEAISAKKEHKAEQLATTKGLYSKLTKARTQLSALRKKQEKILESSLSVEEKKARLDRIDAKVMEVVIPLLAKYRALEELAR